MGWNSMTWLATTGSLWSARRSRVWSQEGRRQLRGSAPAGGASPPLLYKWLFSGPFFGRFIKKRPTLTTNHLLFTFHLYKYLSLVSSLWALIFIQYLLFIEKYIFRNLTYLLFSSSSHCWQNSIPSQRGCFKRHKINVGSGWLKWLKGCLLRVKRWMIGHWRRWQEGGRSRIAWNWKMFWTIAYLLGHSPVVHFRWQS